MIATRYQMPLTAEFVKWLVLIGGAVALIAALATAVAAVEPMAEPARLPDDIGLLAKPMEVQPIKPFFPDEAPAVNMPPDQTVATLWATLEAQRAGRVAEAVDGWRTIRLPAETEVWREVALAAAHLTAGNLDAAQTHIDRARLIAPDQAVVAYYAGVLRLEQAAGAVRVPDELTEGDMRTVALTTAQVPARGIMAAVLLKAMARAELNMAIARAGEVRLDQRLIIGDTDMEERIVVPRVGDLLVALGADNFTAKAHHLLFGLELARGQLAQAEAHLDLAVAMGVAPLNGYEDLAGVYLDQGQEAAAMRAARKDLQANYPLLFRSGQEMNDAVGRLWDGWVW